MFEDAAAIYQENYGENGVQIALARSLPGRVSDEAWTTRGSRAARGLSAARTKLLPVSGPIGPSTYSYPPLRPPAKEACGPLERRKRSRRLTVRVELLRMTPSRQSDLKHHLRSAHTCAQAAIGDLDWITMKARDEDRTRRVSSSNTLSPRTRVRRRCGWHLGWMTPGSPGSVLSRRKRWGFRRTPVRRTRCRVSSTRAVIRQSPVASSQLSSADS